MTYPHGVKQESHPTFLHTHGIDPQGEPYITDTQLELPSVKTSKFELAALYDYIKSHKSTVEQPLPTPAQLEQIQINPVSGCWELPIYRDGQDVYPPNSPNAGKPRARYGSLMIREISKTRTLAHRILFIVMRGPIPDDIVLDHLCENKKCCYHRHLDPVTQGDNTRRIQHAKRLKSGQAPLF